MASKLRKSSFTASRKESIKYRLDCNSKITQETPDTGKWLNVIKKIRNSNILIGSSVDTSKKTVVVKFESYKEMEKEYSISKKIYDSKIPNFIKYYCFFSCNEDTSKFEILEYDEKKTSLCSTNPGKITGFILMPFYSLGSIAQYSWHPEHLQILKNILTQVTIALFSSFKELGFVHLDLHLDNILLRKTKKQEVKYTCVNKKIKPEGFYPIIMDFGRAKVSGTLGEYKTSLMKMYSLLRDIGENTKFILDPLPLVNGIRYSQTFDIENVLKLVDNIKIDYIKDT